MVCPCLIVVDYTVTVTLVRADETLYVPQTVPLQCNISPTPPFPVVYTWRSSTQNHYIYEMGFSNEDPTRTLIHINERQPSFGHYFCHVVSASNHTTLAVGHINVFLSGESYYRDNAHANWELDYHGIVLGILWIDPIPDVHSIYDPITDDKIFFTPPSSLQVRALIPSEFSQRRLLNSLRNLTYEWKHNDTMLSDQVVNKSTLVIAPTSGSDAGIYTVKITSFGLPNVTNEKCAAIVLEHLTDYAIFQEAAIYAYNRLSKI